MGDVKRYDLDSVATSHPCWDRFEMVEQDPGGGDGQWVSAEDYDALAKQLATSEEVLGKVCDARAVIVGQRDEAIAENDAMKIRRGLSGVGPLVIVSCPEPCGVSMTLPFDQYSWTCMCGAEVSTPDGVGLWLIDEARRLAEALRDRLHAEVIWPDTEGPRHPKKRLSWEVRRA